MGKRARDRKRTAGTTVTRPQPAGVFDSDWPGAAAFADAAELHYRERRQALGADPAAVPYLQELATVVQHREQLEARQADLVRRARDHGATWPVLGRVLGVSAQAVQQRWGDRG